MRRRLPLLLLFAPVLSTSCVDDPVYALDASLTGKVCGTALGTVLTNADVTLDIDNAGTWTTTTDDAGLFLLEDITAGAGVLTVDDGEEVRVLDVVVQASVTTVVVDDVCPAAPSGVLTGTVCNDDGSPISAVELWRDGSLVSTTTTSADGMFSIGGLSTGAVELHAGDVVFAVTVTNGETTTLWDARCGVACEETVTVSAAQNSAQVDIIVVVDGSRSMQDAATAVQRSLNTFSTTIENAGLDHHVVMIGDLTVPAPLGGSSRLRTITTDVGSKEPLQAIVNTHNSWSSFVRADSQKHFIIVTDDESDLSAAAFTNTVDGWSGFAGGWTLHAVASTAADVSSGCGAARGRVYETLVAATGGTSASVCDANYDEVFDVVAAAITAPPLPCELLIPNLPANTVFSSAVVTLTNESGTVVDRWNAASTLGCDGEAGFSVDTGDPVALLACTDTCALIQSTSGTLTAVVACVLRE